MFSSVVTRHWIAEELDSAAEGRVRVVIDPSLSASRSVSLLRVPDGRAVLTLTPERAAQLALVDTSWVDTDRLAGSLAEAGIVLNDADHLFYLSAGEQAACRREPA